MSGEQFVEALKRVGYPSVDRLSGQNFDWLFDCEALAPFLKWFSEELQPSNVLDNKDLDEYHLLEDAESKTGASSLLTGTELEDALDRWSLIDNVDGSVTETELAHMREELALHRRRRDELKLLHDRLVLHHTTLVDKLARLDTANNAAQTEYQISTDQIHHNSSNWNKMLESLLTSVSQLLAVYKSMSASQQCESALDNSILLSHINMEHYHGNEERFTQELVAFTKKQFFDGIAEIAGPTEGADYELVEISNPNLLLVKGASEDVVLEACKDLTHIHLLYPVSETKRIDALIEEQSATGACEFQEQMMKQLKDNPYSQDIPSLSARLKDAHTALSSLNRDLNHLTDVKIPSQIKDAASLQAVKVLRGDYELKIARQDYFTSNQDQVINELVVQRSRNEFLTMALELEARSHREVHKLLTAITLLMEKMYTTFNDRMKMMMELEKSTSRITRTTVDSRDKFLHSIHQMIADDSVHEDQKNKSLFVTYSQMEQNVDKFAHQMSALRASLSASSQIAQDRQNSLDRALTQCEAVVYADSSTTGGQPSLSPRPILDTMMQLNNLLQKLEQVVKDIINDIDNKKKTLKKDSLLKTERELFSYFYNDPSRLRHCVHDIESRVQAHATC